MQFDRNGQMVVNTIFSLSDYASKIGFSPVLPKTFHSESEIRRAESRSIDKLLELQKEVDTPINIPQVEVTTNDLPKATENEQKSAPSEVLKETKTAESLPKIKENEGEIEKIVEKAVEKESQVGIESQSPVELKSSDDSSIGSPTALDNSQQSDSENRTNSQKEMEITTRERIDSVGSDGESKSRPSSLR